MRRIRITVTKQLPNGPLVHHQAWQQHALLGIPTIGGIGGEV